VFLKEFLEICVNTCSRKLLAVAKESKDNLPENAELKREWLKCSNVQIYCIWCFFSMRVNISRKNTLNQR
jgi:hypothetical protein